LVCKTIPWALTIIQSGLVNIKFSTWFFQDHSLGQGGHRGQYLVLKTIPWDKVDIEVSTWFARPSPVKGGHRGKCLVLNTIPWDKVGGHRGQYLILKTIPWEKVDIWVGARSSRPSPGTRWTSR
jgi:hypothetical protein